MFMFVEATDGRETVICLKVLCKCRSVIDAMHKRNNRNILILDVCNKLKDYFIGLM